MISLKLIVSEYLVRFVQLRNSVRRLLITVIMKVMFTLEQATKAQMGSRGIALFFLQPRR